MSGKIKSFVSYFPKLITTAKLDNKIKQIKKLKNKPNQK